jgi:hypothetical protein
MIIRETQKEYRERIILETIPTIENKPISLGELTKLVNDKIPYDMYKMSELELSRQLKIIKEYKRYTSQQGATEYIFIKWRRPKRYCRHCKMECQGKICRECFKKKRTGCVSRAISRRKNGKL